MRADPIHIAVLAGGQSRRMGRDKALLTLNGQTLIECVLAAAHPLECPTFIVGDPAAYAQLGPPVYPDHRPNLGPIGGLFTALELAAGPVLLLACDLPFLTPEFLRYLISRRGTHQARVPSTAEGSQPLCALYEPSCLEVIAAAIGAKRLPPSAGHRSNECQCESYFRRYCPSNRRERSSHRTFESSH